MLIDLTDWIVLYAVSAMVFKTEAPDIDSSKSKNLGKKLTFYAAFKFENHFEKTLFINFNKF